MEAAKRLSATAADPSMRYRAALLVANAAAVAREHSQAVQHLTLALALEDRVPDPDLRRTGAVVAAIVYNELGHPDQARAYAERALIGTPNPRLECGAHESLARAIVTPHPAIEPSLDDAQFKVGIRTCRAARFDIGMHLIESSYARYLVRTGRLSEARALVHRALPGATRTGYSRLLAELYATLASIELERGDLEASERAAKQILAIKERPSDWEPYATALDVLSRIALAQGDAEGALRYARRLNDVQRASLRQDMAREVAYQVARHEVLVKARDAQLIAQRSRALELERQVLRERERRLRVIIVALGLGAAGLAYWGWQYRRTHRMLQRLSEVDVLTGLSNRRHFEISASAALAGGAHERREACVLVIDLDWFKQINDRCGHAAGDWVLREVARAATEVFGHEAVTGRLGGEEFAVVMPSTSLSDAMSAADRFRDRLRALDAMDGGCFLPVTASVGVASTERWGYSYRALLAAADDAMYAAKLAGRDRTLVADGVPAARRQRA